MQFPLLLAPDDLRYLASKDGEDAADGWPVEDDVSSWFSFLMKTTWLLLADDAVTGGLLDADADADVTG